jgi:hypothetical protein
MFVGVCRSNMRPWVGWGQLGFVSALDMGTSRFRLGGIDDDGRDTVRASSSP